MAAVVEAAAGGVAQAAQEVAAACSTVPLEVYPAAVDDAGT